MTELHPEDEELVNITFLLVIVKKYMQTTDTAI